MSPSGPEGMGHVFKGREEGGTRRWELAPVIAAPSARIRPAPGSECHVPDAGERLGLVGKQWAGRGSSSRGCIARRVPRTYGHLQVEARALMTRLLTPPNPPPKAVSLGRQWAGGGEKRNDFPQAKQLRGVKPAPSPRRAFSTRPLTLPRRFASENPAVRGRRLSGGGREGHGPRLILGLR